MPFGVCERCHRYYVLGSDEDEAPSRRGPACPACGASLRPAARDEILQFVTDLQQGSEPQDPGFPGPEPQDPRPSSLVVRCC